MTTRNDSGSKTPAPVTPGSANPSPAEPRLESPMKPLMWVLIPFILVIAYGMLFAN